jgi:phosphonate transport system substrate-binding protein
LELDKEEVKMLKKIILFIYVLPVFLLGCQPVGEKTVNVSLSERELLNKEARFSASRSFHVAVGGMTVPDAGYSYYVDLLKYIEKKFGVKVTLVDKGSYAEINQWLKSGEIEAAFVCGGPYVDGHDEFGLELIAMPQVNGAAAYYSYIIVHKDSPAKGIEDLRGKVFAFTDPQSNSGKLAPTYLLSSINETPETFFSKDVYTNNHDTSIRAVADKIVDGAAVDSLVWDYMDKTEPQVTSRTKIIWKSESYGSPPFAVRRDIPEESKQKLRDIFLGIHQDAEGQEILKNMMIDKFVAGDDSAYDTIRNMKKHFERKNQ